MVVEQVADEAGVDDCPHAEVRQDKKDGALLRRRPHVSYGLPHRIHICFAIDRNVAFVRVRPRAISIVKTLHRPSRLSLKFRTWA